MDAAMLLPCSFSSIAAWSVTPYGTRGDYSPGACQIDISTTLTDFQWQQLRTELDSLIPKLRIADAQPPVSPHRCPSPLICRNRDGPNKTWRNHRLQLLGGTRWCQVDSTPHSIMDSITSNKLCTKCDSQLFPSIFWSSFFEGGGYFRNFSYLLIISNYYIIQFTIEKCVLCFALGHFSSLSGKHPRRLEPRRTQTFNGQSSGVSPWGVPDFDRNRLDVLSLNQRHEYGGEFILPKWMSKAWLVHASRM